MKIRVVLDILGLILVLLGSLMLIPGIVAAIYKEPAGVMAFGLSSFITISAGLIIRRIGEKGEVTNKEAFVIVALAWLLATIFGSLPFMYVFSMPALRLAFVGLFGPFCPHVASVVMVRSRIDVPLSFRRVPRNFLKTT